MDKQTCVYRSVKLIALSLLFSRTLYIYLHTFTHTEIYTVPK